MFESHNHNTTVHPSVIQPFLHEMMAISGLSLNQIAKECHVSSKELRRHLLKQVETISSSFFNKILCCYCALCYNSRGEKLPSIKNQ